MKKLFEISVYNKDVRDEIQAGRNHRLLEPSWANVHLIEIKADTEEEAMASCRRKHPERLGFVLGSALEVA